MTTSPLARLNRTYIFDRFESGDASALFYMSVCLLAEQDAQKNMHGISLLQENFDDIELSEHIKMLLDVNPTRDTVNKTQAATTAMTSDAFEEDPEFHLAITAGLLGHDPSPSVLEEIDYEDVLVASLEVAILRGEPVQTSPSVERLQEELADAAGFDPEELAAAGIEETDAAKVAVMYVLEYLAEVQKQFQKAGFPDSVVTALKDSLAA